MRPAFVLPLLVLLAACAPPAPRAPGLQPPPAGMPPALSSSAKPTGTPANSWCYEVGNAPAPIALGCKPDLETCDVALVEARQAALADGFGDPFSACRAMRNEDIRRPRRLSGNMPVYPLAAREAHVQGKAVAQCTITVEGNLESCKILQSLPLMDHAFLDALTTWRFEPILFLGRPIRALYTVPFKIVVE